MRIKKICLFMVLCLVTLNITAQDYDDADTLSAASEYSSEDNRPWEEKISDRIDALLQSKIFKTSTVGLEIYDLTDNKVLYAYNEQQTMRPASTQKMLTAVTALDRLGGSHEFKTSLYHTGEIANGTLNGSLYCVGGFDPAFGNEDLETFVSAVRTAGIDTILGNICIDLCFKDDKMLGEGWCWDDDNPVLTPLMLNKKDDFIERFTALLEQRGVVINGYLSQERTPSSAQQICLVTHSMDRVLNRMMKNSDNTYAEAMFYQLGSSAEKAKVHFNSIIRKVGLDSKDYYVADGSGLSLYNYVSPHEEVLFLKYAYENKDIFSHLYPSLPIAGVDGTLKSRMRGTHAEGNVRAKTGTVEGVSSLAGYLDAPNGHLICFSIINMGIRRSSTGRNFQNKLCNALCSP
ncbi:MAG: D-alanyl-D-alanine carboxypeptidase/D-alanyl-D-alanine-endopeptidase [Prevotella sp.]|uniref:D-alanyl-D-alanine carboxypeptidase/D-alanyl-D-alanine endopeptidase n=1 Tax=Prevotella sp. TaxID=59823 RepID=UPI002A2D1597|nr:D-alanyl-D-alanine carboxypeptidase/D-alanyl-D-alanine-endopeptidase [Prevotella sp.]MDD7318692.1 D-alanyl-D-alanine carboxypeptidase/D-alanyl-D-alanine-endopeptidase [Prevotellaceae bacterium]MDY4019351.1 D-alanyl-D-alanine carboxypeptidase/D-alanyl-D-alanine-endopeptidase [Prevotella sp.]